MNSDKLNTALLHRASRYALAVGAVTLGSLLRYGMDVWVGPGLPTYITFYPAVMLAALLGGFGPGFLATVLAAAVADYLLLPPLGLGIASFRDAVGVGLFLFLGVFMSAVAQLYRRARIKAVAYDQEVALREINQQKNFLADVLQRSSQPFAVGYPDGRLGLLNNAFEQLTGYTRDELQSLDWARVLTPPEWQDIEQKKLEDLRRSGQPIRYEKEYIRKDGSRVPIELLTHLMTDADGSPEYYYSFLTDITERKQLAEAQLFLLQCGYKSLDEDFFESLARYLAEKLHMYYVCIDQLQGDDLTAKTIAIYCNGKFEDNVEYTLKDTPCGEVVGKTICCFPKDVCLLFPRDKVLQEMHAESYAGTTLWSSQGKPIGLIAVIGLQQLPNPGLTESILQLFAMRAAGELERRQAEKALRESEQLYRAIGESIDYGVWVCAPDGRNTYASQSFLDMVGLTQKQCSDFGWGDVLRLDDSERTIAAWKECAQKGGTWDIEHRFRGVDGQWHPVLARGVPIRDEQGSITAWAGINLDISRLKQAEEALHRANDELEQRVQERTAMLNKVNELLRVEIAERQKATEEIQDLYNNAPCGYHSLDPDGTFVRINNTELSLLGYSRDEIIGRKKFSDLLTASSLDFFKKSFPLFKERGFMYDLEFDMIRQDGSILPVLVSATAILDEQGKYIMSRSSVLDITERRRTEETLRESEERFRLLIHTAPVVIVSLSPDGTVLEFNPEAELAYGRTRAEVLGRNYLDLFIPSGQQDMVTGAMKRVLAGEPISSYENPIRGADGSEQFYIWNIDRMIDDKGNPVALIAVGHDVTERRKMLEALEAAAAYTRSLIEASLDPLVTISRDGVVMDMNRAAEQIVNLPRAQIIGTDFSDYFTDPEKARKGFQHVFKRGFVRDYPLAIKGRFGVVRDVLYNATVYRNRAGEIEGIFAAARDITKRKRAEERLRESEERLKFLSARLLEVQEHERKSIATELHDSVASSLTAVILGLSRARPAIEACDPLYRDIIASSIAMLQNAIDETRQLMNALRPPMLDDFGLISSLRWFTEQYQALYPQLTTETEITIEESMIPAHLKIVLFRIIQEAFTNIAKHSRAQAASLYLKQKENTIDLVIADDGAGFDQEAASSKQEPDRGLGILSMHERAELSGGNLIIESAHGQGTIISVSWPLQP